MLMLEFLDFQVNVCPGQAGRIKAIEVTERMTGKQEGTKLLADDSEVIRSPEERARRKLQLTLSGVESERRKCPVDGRERKNTRDSGRPLLRVRHQALRRLLAIFQ